ncbi:Cytochrome b5 [Symbiodinium microadriaticum]|uniref:Cytochrome b5 n=1 Tax=Symbiodinium microadriaticum TaxID=2951 RepID=A0A1Q9F3Q8_SYMMI|nr:Cytochrome b5 [Symbiodinium microadriaticum]
MGNACPARKSLDGSSREKISMQTVKERGYVVLFNKVYNLKDYVRKHPGGQDILLSVFGRDATGEHAEKGRVLMTSERRENI